MEIMLTCLGGEERPYPLVSRMGQAGRL
jgi:hypothetical protein